MILAMPVEELGYCLLRVHQGYLEQYPASRNVHRQALVDTASPPGGAERFSQAMRRRVDGPLNEALHWAEGQGLLMPAPGINGQNGHLQLTRRGEEALAARDFTSYVKAAQFPKALLHPSISEAVWMDIARGDLDGAVRRALLAVEVAVRAAGNYQNTDYGVPLMKAAFDPQNGRLTRMTDPRGEREGLLDLFVGAMKSYRNPHSHRTVGLSDVSDAYEQVMFASHLLRIVDSRRP
jgi:uncharacterized protein (TIGR02391 family)